jgi:hypothetical protein
MQATAFINLLHTSTDRLTQQRTAEKLNEMNFKTPRGTKMSPGYYRQCLMKVREYEEEIQQLIESKHPEEETQWLN